MWTSRGVWHVHRNLICSQRTLGKYHQKNITVSYKPAWKAWYFLQPSASTEGRIKTDSRKNWSYELLQEKKCRQDQQNCVLMFTNAYLHHSGKTQEWQSRYTFHTHFSVSQNWAPFWFRNGSLGLTQNRPVEEIVLLFCENLKAQKLPPSQVRRESKNLKLYA